MKYQCAYLVSSLLFVSTCLFVSPVHAVSDLLETSVKNVTSKSVEISFTPFRESRSSCVDNGFWYNYQLLNGEKKVMKTVLNSTPYFELYDLKPNTDYGYYVQAVKISIDDKNYCGRSRVGTSVQTTYEDVSISDLISFTTKSPTTKKSTSDEPQMLEDASGSLIVEEYAYVSALFSYRAYNMQGKPVGKIKNFELDMRYDEQNDAVPFNLHNAGEALSDWNVTHLQLYTGEGSVTLGVFGSSSAFIYPLDKKVRSPSKILETLRVAKGTDMQWNYSVDLMKRGQKFVVYDTKVSDRYYVITLKALVKSDIAPPNVATPYGGLNMVPYVRWSEKTYSINTIKNVSLEYRCPDCLEERLRSVQHVSIPYNSLSDSSWWQNYLIPEEKSALLNKEVLYRVRTHFSSGKSSPWTIWTSMKLVEKLPS